MPTQTRPGRHRVHQGTVQPVSGIARGTSSWLNHSSDTAAAFASHGASIVAAWLDWATFEQNPDVFDWGNLDTADTNGFDHAHDNDYKILLRIAAGVESPIGRPGTGQADWLFSTFGVARVRTVDNTDDTEVYVPYPWDANLRSRYNVMMTEVARFLQEPCPQDTTHRRKQHCAGVMASCPTEHGTEMVLGYGTSPAYLGAATLTNAMGTGGPPIQSFKLTGTLTGYPTNRHIVKIGTERILCSQRVGPNVTWESGGRGHTGTTIASHAAGSVVTYADPTATLGNATTPYVFNGVSSIWDHRLLNRAQWDATGVDEATRRTNTAAAWVTNVTDMVTLLPIEVPVLLAIGNIFEDAYANVSSITTSLATLHESRFWVGVTDVRATPARAIISDPIGTYADQRPENGAAILQGLALGARSWGQLSSVSIIPNGQRLVDSTEAFINAYQPSFIEMNMTNRFDATTYTTWAAHGWPGGTNRTTKQYAVSDAVSVQARLLAAIT